MCIIVDPPLFVPMFKPTDPEHGVYHPVKKWVDDGPGKFVVGGTMYSQELAKIGSVLKHLAEYERKGKIVRNPTDKVDLELEIVKKIEQSKDFDDPHLIALVRACGCKLICVRDPRSHKYLRAGKFYNSLKHRPKLYTRAKNADLLCKSNISACCNCQ